MKFSFDTTIAALTTGYGGAISVIRISGPKVFRIIDSVFRPSSEAVSIGKEKGYTVHYGDILDNDEIIDDVLVTVYRAPHSYTGEDAAEISCHASLYIQQRIMQLLTSRGAIPAQPGEFTMRAFMNGKMDLSQAEAVADLIASDSEAAHRLAMTQLRGEFSAEIEKLRQELLRFASLMELELDFSEEDVEFADRTAMSETIIKIKDLVDRLVTSFRLGNAIKKGIPVVIAGRPNTGKSSLLNVLLQEERAIVSDMPGTTRDTIEEVLHLGGLLFRFIDTAGLREAEVEDKIEIKGIERTKASLQKADVVLAVAEASDNVKVIDTFLALMEKLAGPHKRIILVLNKSDLLSQKELKQLRKAVKVSEQRQVAVVSALKSEGIGELRTCLLQSVEKGGLSTPQYIVTNLRHYEALRNVSESLGRALEGFRNGIPTELIATDVRQAIYYLGLITGKITPDDILGEIFSKFCIGK